MDCNFVPYSFNYFSCIHKRIDVFFPTSVFKVFNYSSVCVCVCACEKKVLLLRNGSGSFEMLDDFRHSGVP